MRAAKERPSGRASPVSRRGATRGPPSVHHVACAGTKSVAEAGASSAMKPCRTRSRSSAGERSCSSASRPACSDGGQERCHRADMRRPVDGGDGRYRQRRIASGLVHARQPYAQHAVPAAKARRQHEAPDRRFQPRSNPLFPGPLLCAGQATLPPGIPGVGEIARQVLAHEVTARRQLAEQAGVGIGWKRRHRLASHAPTDTGSPARPPARRD